MLKPTPNDAYRLWVVRLGLIVNTIAMISVLPKLLAHQSNTPTVFQRYDIDYFAAIVLYGLLLLAMAVNAGLVNLRPQILERWLEQTKWLRQRLLPISILIASLWIFWVVPFTWSRGFAAVKNIEQGVEINVFVWTIMLAFLYEGQGEGVGASTALYKRRLISWIAVGFTLFALMFIYQTSFIGIDGKRYFSLFDDAMISMRYAWNLANGHGLVWNPGEYVEGYTNLLMTLVMTVANFFFKADRRYAVLAIQLFGVPTMLCIAYATSKMAEHLREEMDLPEFFMPLVFLVSLAYYPLVYFSLMGMETGLLTLLLLAGTATAFGYVKHPSLSRFILLPTLLGLAYLARPDSLIISALILGYVVIALLRKERNTPTLVKLGGLGAIFLVLPVLQQVFRAVYYGDVVPNTYTLKMTGMPTDVRVINGINFLLPFLWEMLPLYLIIAAMIISKRSMKLILLVSIPLALIAYQIWVGGDVWEYWRIVAPGIPFLMVLLLALVFHLFRQKLTSHYSPTLIGTVIGVVCLLHINGAFLPEISFRVRPYDYLHNRRNVNWALALNQITTPDATIGVFSAGSVPYYTDLYAIDFLGKADRYIAHLPPDLSGAVRGFRMTTLPGHNKYDLHYSIVELQPTYVMNFKWGNDDLSEWGKENYVQVEYKGVYLFLRRDSENVRWELVEMISSN